MAIRSKARKDSGLAFQVDTTRQWTVSLGDGMVLVRFSRPGELPSDTYGEARDDNRFNEIVIDRDIRGLKLLDTAIHEATHRAMPYLTEEVVLRFATDLTSLLVQMGFFDGSSEISQ
jgi:hypothetical protein